MGLGELIKAKNTKIAVLEYEVRDLGKKLAEAEAAAVKNEPEWKKETVPAVIEIR